MKNKKYFGFILILMVIVFSYLLTFNISLASDCTITSAEWNPFGEQSDTFYKDDVTVAYINVKTQNCQDKQLGLSIYESDGVTNVTDDTWDNSGLYNKVITAPSDNFAIKIKLGEEDCESIAGGGVGYDCDLYFKMGDYDSYNKTKGMLYYECDDLCLNNGQYLGTFTQGNNDNPVNLELNKTPEKIPGIYKLLAPIGKLTCIGNSEECTIKDNVGSYFNVIFKLAIALCGVLAVIMIVIGGVQYMGDESIFGKTEAKSKITSAILGLIIALASYALLNTINPDLLGGGGVNIKQVSAEIEDETEIVPWSESANITGTTESCKDGYVNISTYGTPATINVCKSVSVKLKNMLDEAKRKNIILTGYGSRTYDQQVAKRRANGCPDIYKSPAKDCNPDTAKPGLSKHESGKAVDFRCNGKTMTEAGGKNSVCFKWLKDNAKNFGFYNLKNGSESWHWSDDGR